jgi:HAE1 family hydrophobic/amphiphilic exporter-1
MNIVGLSIRRPVGVTVAALLLVMFGLIGLTAIPVQLTPTVDYPIVTVETAWPGRSPEEIVDEITKEQEENLKNISNLKTMRSTSAEGLSTITLEFYLGADVTRALQEVSDALRQVPDYPDEVTEPTIKDASGAAESAIAWIIVDLDPQYKELHPDFDITTLFDSLDKEVRPLLERIDGVAEANVYGGREREVRVLADNERLAQRGLNIADLIEALRRENVNTSAGSISEGKRDYRVRVVGQFDSPSSVLEVEIANRDGRPVYVGDVATVEIGHTKQRGFVRSFGYPSIAINIIRQTGANVIDVMEDVRTNLDDVHEGILPNIGGDAGPHLRMRQVYDETVYIDSSIKLVTQNLWIGGTIAALVLLIFLRSFVTTGIVAMAIPISVIGTFLVLLALGRTLNVISLAGIAFAVGMVVDNAIVVLENIYRRYQGGLHPMKAAYEGGKEVWGAVLASTLTTAAVFVPVLTIQEEAGQLFRDISIAIVSSVVISLIVSMTVIPAACSRWLKPHTKEKGGFRSALDGMFGLNAFFGKINAFCASVIRALQLGLYGWTIRPLIIVVMTVSSLTAAMMIVPPMDYLPAGNQNLVFGGLLIPPGLSLPEKVDFAERIEAKVLPYMEGNTDLADLSPISSGQGEAGFNYDAVQMENFFIGAFGDSMFVGGTSTDPSVVIPIGQLLTNSMLELPDTYGGASQASIFGQGFGGGNSIDVEIMGPDLERVIAAASVVFQAAADHDAYGYGRVAASPSNYNIGQPEIQVTLTRQARELGLRPRDVGVAVRSLFDGAFVDDYTLEGEAVDMVVLPAGGQLEFLEQMATIPVATPMGPVVPLDMLVDVRGSTAPQSIQRIQELSAVSLQITPPPGMAVQDVMDQISNEFLAPAREAGLIDSTMRVRLEGTAAKLDEVQAALFGDTSTASTDTSAAAAGRYFAFGLVIVGFLVAGLGFIRAVSSGKAAFGYGGTGALILLGCIGILLFGVSNMPQLMLARFIWSLAVTYLLMCALFESFIYPFVIMFSVPLAVVGGFFGLKIVHDVTATNPIVPTQQLDVLTMLGFVILIGVVVNNAILIVHQSLNFMKGHADEGEAEVEPMAPADAISESVRTRIRPIFMSTLTSVGGMLPLVLMPGAGSEIYRGLGSVVVGGLLVSTVFTLILVPLLLGLVIDMSRGLAQLFGREQNSLSHDAVTS